jgi:hypothetical protein
MIWTNIAVLCTSAPHDGLSTEDQPRPLVPSGRWVIDIVVPAFERAGIGVTTVSPTSSGYTVLTLHGTQKRYRFIVSDIHPIYVCEIMEDRTLVDWLRRAPRDPQFKAALDVACAALRSDQRVQELLAFSGEKPKGTAFVGETIEKLERKLGIYSR